MLHYQNEIVFLKMHNPTLWEELIEYFKKNNRHMQDCCPFYLIVPNLYTEDKTVELLTNKMSSISEEDYNKVRCAQKAKYITIKGLCNILNIYPDGFASIINHMASKILKWWKDYKQTILTNHYNNILNQKKGITHDSSQTSFDQLKEENTVLKKDKSIMNVRLLDCIYHSNALQTSFDQLNKEHVVLKKDKSIMNDSLIACRHSFNESREHVEQLENDSNALQTSFDQLKEENTVLKKEKSSMNDTGVTSPSGTGLTGPRGLTGPVFIGPTGPVFIGITGPTGPPGSIGYTNYYKVDHPPQDITTVTELREWINKSYQIWKDETVQSDQEIAKLKKMIYDYETLSRKQKRLY